MTDLTTIEPDQTRDAQQPQYSAPYAQQQQQSYPPQQRPTQQQYPQHQQNYSQLPPGWLQQFDQQSQRFYYVEQATGRTQWEVPQHPVPQQQYSAPPPPTGGAYGGYQPPVQGQPGQPSPYGQPQGDQQRGQASSFYNNYNGAPSAPLQGQQAQQYDTRTNQYSGDADKKEKDKKSSGYGGAIGGAAAGVAVGAIGGALIANAMGEC
jgi:hypothetical protein